MPADVLLTQGREPSASPKGPDPTAPTTPAAPITPEAPPTKPTDSSMVGLWDTVLKSVQGETAAPREAQEKAYKAGEEFFKETVIPAADAVQKAASVAAPPVPKAIPQPPVPDIHPRAFLSSEAKDGLKTAISGLGLLATTIMGARNAPQAGLFALSGAMNGWAEGDRIRADRDWRTYLAYVDKVKHENDLAFKEWEAAMTASSTNLTRAQANFAVAMAAQKLPEFAIAAADRGLAAVEKDIVTTRSIVDMLVRNAETVSRDRATEIYRLEQARDRRAALALAEKRTNALVYGITDPAGVVAAVAGEPQAAGGGEAAEPPMKMWARRTLINGERPPFGRMSYADRAAYNRYMAELTPQYGGVEGSILRKDTDLALKAGLRELTAVQLKGNAWATLAHRNLQQLEALSQKVDRTGAPMLNKWILAGRKAWSGDPDVTAYASQIDIVVRELSRSLDSPNATGVISVNSQEHMRDMLQGEFTHDQILASIKLFDGDLQRRQTAYNEAVEATKQSIVDNARPDVQQKKADAPGGRIRVIGPDGKPGTVPAGTDLSKYPGWKAAP